MKALIKYLTLSLLFFSIPTLSNALPECEGTFHNCAGIKTWENGDEYYGDFKNNKKHGYGTYYYKSGNKYVGDWLNNKRTGEGKFTFADGDKYVGDFLNNKRHGKGTYTYKNGDKYVGDWVNGKRTGKGIFTFADGTKQEGVFRDSKFLFSEKIDKKQNINDSNNPISLALKQKPVEIKKTTKEVSKDNNNSISSALNKKPVKINKPSKKINKESNNSISRGLSKKPVEVKKPIIANKPIKKINKKIVKNKSINDKPFKILRLELEIPNLEEYNSTKSVGWDKVNPAIKFLIEQPFISLNYFNTSTLKDLVVEKALNCGIKIRKNLPVSKINKYGKVEKISINFNNINWKTETYSSSDGTWKYSYQCPKSCYSYYGHPNYRYITYNNYINTVTWYNFKKIDFRVYDDISSRTRFNNAMSDIRKFCNASTSKY